MNKRPLGKTGEKVSLLGMGGFHLLEISQSQVHDLLNRYLDMGGNYIETSASYGDGESERKIGKAVKERRDDYMLATKVDARDKDEALSTLERSLRHLETDYVDIWFMHAVQDRDAANAILAPGGALEAAEKAREQGKIRFIGITGHGQPFGLMHALQKYDFDAVMVPTNYYDHFNFPDISEKLIPLAQLKGTAVAGMKAFADGYLWRSPEQALRFALSLPVSMIVAGMNKMEYLEKDIALAEKFEPLSHAEVGDLYREADEYRNYVCRQCPKCDQIKGIPVKRIFELEGWYDRQMWDGKVVNPEDYALRVRLGPWFHQQDAACNTFYWDDIKLDESDYNREDLKDFCPYGIDIPRKLRIAVSKLSSDWSLE
jgi:predicted aldo/keto reductase-like oxidoreductase